MQQLPDTPIFSPDQDLFSLSPFSQRLARVLRASQTRQNMVVGLNGIWGGGKTSVLNMAIAWLMAMEKARLDRYAASERDERAAMDALLGKVALEDHESHLSALESGWGGEAGGQTVIVRYNPWLVSGHETLVSDFFRILADRVAEVLDNDLRLSIRASANRLADFMDLTQQASSGMGRLLALYAEASGGGPLSDKQDGARRSGFLKGLFRKVTANPIPETLQEARDQLAAQLDKLAALNRHILVIIEDIDRLRTDEVRPLLSMMKAIGQLPAVTYLIGYDRSVLERALGETTTVDGLPKFLEKIVQVDLDLPRVAGGRLLQALTAHAAEIFGLPLDESETRDLLQTFKRGGVLLSSPRDVGRLRNALVFADAATGRSLRTTDLIRMEMLRLKERDVFDWIIRNSIYFHPRIGIAATDMADSRDSTFVEEGLARASIINRDAVADLLSHTFGNVAFARGDSPSAPRDRMHDLDTRYPLYSREGWECYLQSFPNADIIAQEELAYVLHIAGDLQKSRSYVQTLMSRRRSDGGPLLMSFLEGIDRLPRGSEPVGLINALLELDDNIVATSFGMTHQSALRSLSKLLAHCDRPAEVLLGLTLKEGVNAFAVLVVLEVFAEQLGLMSKGKSREESIFGEGELIEGIATVYLRMSSVPAERSAQWFATVDVHSLLAIGLDRKALLQFTQKVLSKSSVQLRYLLEEVCTNWPSRHGVQILLTRRPDPELYPLQDMRSYAGRMARMHPDDDFFQDFVQAADEFLATPTLHDRSQRLKAQFERNGER